MGLGNVAYSQGDYAAVRTYYQDSIAINRELGDRSGIASSLMGLGSVALSQGDNAAARTYYQDSLAINRELGARCCKHLRGEWSGEIGADEGGELAQR